MIVFDLRCVPDGHVFEAWFATSAEYERQRGLGLVQCPLCEAPEVEKAVMAPRLGANGNQAGGEGEMATSHPEGMKEMLAGIAAIQRQMLARSDYVGLRFAEEARAIHVGEAEARSIYGKATRAQTESLIEDGIEVALLPFPVVEPGEEN